MNRLFGAFGICILSLSFAGCATSGKHASTSSDAKVASNSKDTSSTEKKDETKEPSKEDKAKKEKERHEREVKRTKLNRELQIAKEELKKVEKSVEDMNANHKENLDKVMADRDLSARRLKEFDEKHTAVRLERSRLDLQGTRDYVKESEEELAQLEMMYKEADLADKTREIVIQRAQRRLERARKSLEIQTRDSDNLEKATIPVEREDLRIALMQKDQTVLQAQRQAAADTRGKQIELMKAQAEIARIESDIAQVERDEKEAKA